MYVSRQEMREDLVYSFLVSTKGPYRVIYGIDEDLFIEGLPCRDVSYQTMKKIVKNGF